MPELSLSTVCRLNRPTEVVAMARASGDLDGAIAAAANDPGLRGLDDLLRLRRALEEADDPARLAARLRTTADRLERRAGQLFAEGADDLGRAAYRRSQGEADLASEFTRRGVAAETLAAELSEEALSFRLSAADIERRLADARALAAVPSA